MFDANGLESKGFWNSWDHLYPDVQRQHEQLRATRFENTKDKFMSWYEKNKDISWTLSLPKCPDKLCLVKGKR